MASTAELRDFQDLITDQIDVNLPKNILETAVQWVADNMSPESIFDDDTLRKYVGRYSQPDDVFEEKELKAWAESNGYVKE